MEYKEQIEYEINAKRNIVLTNDELKKYIKENSLPDRLIIKRFISVTDNSKFSQNNKIKDFKSNDM